VADNPARKRPQKPSGGPGVAAEIVVSDEDQSQAAEASGGLPKISTTELVEVISHHIKVHQGPYPDPETLAEYAKIYPPSAEIIFKNGIEQSEHRRSLETKLLEHNIKASERGQLLGFALGVIGLLGSFTVIHAGHDTAGTITCGASLIGLVSVFVYGRRMEKQERAEKKSVQDQIARREPVEQVAPPGDSPAA
jgi:uncharacterized membrane protein